MFEKSRGSNNQPKFFFDELKDPEDHFKTNSILQARNSLQFVPYVQERD